MSPTTHIKVNRKIYYTPVEPEKKVRGEARRWRANRRMEMWSKTRSKPGDKN